MQGLGEVIVLEKSSGAFHPTPMARVRQARSLLIEHAETVAKHGLIHAAQKSDFIAFVRGNLARQDNDDKDKRRRRVEAVHSEGQGKRV